MTRQLELGVDTDDEGIATWAPVPWTLENENPWRPEEEAA